MWFDSYYDDHPAYQKAVDDLRRAGRLRRRNRIEERNTKAERADALEQGLGELALFCHAAVDLMIEKGLLTREELVERMREVDASDGTVDGRFTEPV